MSIVAGIKIIGSLGETYHSRLWDVIWSEAIRMVGIQSNARDRWPKVKSDQKTIDWPYQREWQETINNN